MRADRSTTDAIKFVAMVQSRQSACSYTHLVIETLFIYLGPVAHASRKGTPSINASMDAKAVVKPAFVVKVENHVSDVEK